MKTIRAKDLKVGQTWVIGKAKLRIYSIENIGEGFQWTYIFFNRTDVLDGVCKKLFARFLTLAGAKLKKED